MIHTRAVLRWWIFILAAASIMSWPLWIEGSHGGLPVQATETISKTPQPEPSVGVTPTVEARTVLSVSEKEVLWGNPENPYVALTFDADSSPKPLEQILTTLRTKEVSATFFIQGSWAEKFPESVQAIAQDGHEIGNHSYSHPDFRELTEEQVVNELKLAEEALARLSGKSSKPLFRPPYSYRNILVREVAAREGYLTVIWTYDAFDWKRDATEETIYAEILGHAESGAIYVQHVGDQNSANVLGRVIDDLRAEGLEPVTVSRLLSP